MLAIQILLDVAGGANLVDLVLAVDVVFDVVVAVQIAGLRGVSDFPWKPPSDSEIAVDVADVAVVASSSDD